VINQRLKRRWKRGKIIFKMICEHCLKNKGRFEAYTESNICDKCLYDLKYDEYINERGLNQE
jgi:hypothetical protein